LELCGKDRFGELHTGKTFSWAAKKFEAAYEAITQGRWSPKRVQGHKDCIRLHLQPYFVNRIVSQITSGMAQDYRVHRMTEAKRNTQAVDGADAEGEANSWKPPARNTIRNEIATLSMVLKTAQRHGWPDYIPGLSDP
jgi:hypothetical protein